MTPRKDLRDIHSVHDELQLPIVRATREKGAPLTDSERARVMKGLDWRDNSEPCSWCGATGFVGVTLCRECRGTGKAPK